ncbi:non-lysosomal glucosylceramidase, partial [Elysia marginata]
MSSHVITTSSRENTERVVSRDNHKFQRKHGACLVTWYLQLDSWFYPKDDVEAVTTWDAMEEVFPKGIRSVNTTYAKQHGGHFDFFIGNNLSLPVSQDWLNVQLLFTELLNTNLTAGRDWLLQMGVAASNHHLKIQYCMALPRHGLQSLEIPTVTQ